MSSSVTGKETTEEAVPSVEIVPVPQNPSPLALSRAIDRADEYRAHTKAGATQEAYRADWRRFETWARETGAITRPATPQVIAAHLGWLADEGYSVASIERFLAAGSHFHREIGLDFPRGTVVVAETLEGIRRRVGVQRTKKAPLGLQALVEICERLVVQESTMSREDRILSLRNRALLTVGWFCMLRSSNLVSICRRDVRLVRLVDDGWVDDEEHPAGLILHLAGSKTDQRKVGRDVAVHAQANPIVCPVRTLSAYLRATDHAPEAFLFPISTRSVSRLLKRLVANPEHGHRTLDEITRCEACAAIAARFASHSLRRGAATTQAKRGVPEREIMRQGGWKNERVMRGYIEHATLFEANPTLDLTSEEKPKAPPKSEPPPRRRKRLGAARAFGRSRR